MSALGEDLAGRLEALLAALDALGVSRRSGVASRAERLADGVLAADPVILAAVASLVDLDDADDARSPLGVALAGAADDVVTQAFAAAVLEVSRPRVVALVNEGKLDAVDADGVRAVTRASLAARLEALAG